MTSQILTARDTQAARRRSSSLDRLARRTGLALVRWSSRRTDRQQLSVQGMQSLRSAELLRETSRRETQSLVQLTRGLL